MLFVEEDLVDCQPLVIRFVAEPELDSSTAQELASFVSEWFDHEAATNAADWQMAREWSASVTDSGVVAICEFMPMNYVAKLGRDLETAFPMISEIRLGIPLDGPSTCKEMDWLKLPNGEVVIGKRKAAVAPLEITFTPVTLGQFQEFLTATDHSSVPDHRPAECLRPAQLPHDRRRGLAGVFFCSRRLPFLQVLQQVREILRRQMLFQSGWHDRNGSGMPFVDV